MSRPGKRELESYTIKVNYGSKIKEDRKNQTSVRDSEHDQPNILVNADDFFSFSFPDKKKDGEEFYKGRVLCYGEETPAVFFNVDEVDFGVDLFKCRQASNRVSVPNVVKVLGIEMESKSTQGGDDEEEEEGRVFVAYEAFQMRLSSVVFTNQYPTAWWIERIRGIVEALCHMSDAKLYHGRLDDKGSYVFVGNEIHLINVLLLGDNHTPEEKRLAEKEDLQGFLKFLQENAAQAFPEDSKDWTKFIESFRYNNITVQHIRKHPLLLTDEERHRYHRDIITYTKLRMNADERESFEDTLRGLDEFLDWQVNINNDSSHLCWLVENSNGSSTLNWESSSRNGKHLFDHVEKVIDDAQKHIRRISISAVAKTLSETYPGFLSELHGILIRNFDGRLDITRDHPSVTSF